MTYQYEARAKRLDVLARRLNNEEQRLAALEASHRTRAETAARKEAVAWRRVARAEQAVKDARLEARAEIKRIREACNRRTAKFERIRQELDAAILESERRLNVIKESRPSNHGGRAGLDAATREAARAGKETRQPH